MVTQQRWRPVLHRGAAGGRARRGECRAARSRVRRRGRRYPPRSLPQSTARFLGFAAMLGRNFDWHVVAAATGCPPHEAIDRLRQAARAQLIDTDGAGFRFRHALTAEAVRSSLLPEQNGRLSARACLRRCGRCTRTLRARPASSRPASLSRSATSCAPPTCGWKRPAGRCVRDRSAPPKRWPFERKARGPWRRTASCCPYGPSPASRGARSKPGTASFPQRRLRPGGAHRGALRACGRHDHRRALGRRRELPGDPAFRAGLDRPGAARRAVGEAEVALARNDKAAAVAFARPRSPTRGRRARGGDLPGLVGDRPGRAREGHGRGSRRVRGGVRVRLTERPAGLPGEVAAGARHDRHVRDAWHGPAEEARREALAAGAISMVAMVDLQLAATYSARGQADLTLAAAARCEEASRQFGLAFSPDQPRAPGGGARFLRQPHGDGGLCRAGTRDRR